ncbi:hypothetical protein M3603_15615 [Rummeliibacillus stabekisii]|uniref:hypothetical protein n=1 Tax=Rummeliibacillus stabekisii TaxID=241244 RepID=UPI00203B7F81|nr:hypothetical protein [Rummeliibacillus stabekisii]MCM3318045.1 hypothetical protein [Rummeliibacillus stabekisii]
MTNILDDEKVQVKYKGKTYKYSRKTLKYDINFSDFVYEQLCKYLNVTLKIQIEQNFFRSLLYACKLVAIDKKDLNMAIDETNSSISYGNLTSKQKKDLPDFLEASLKYIVPKIMAKEKFDEEIKDSEQAHWNSVCAIEKALGTSKDEHEVIIKKVDLEAVLTEYKKSHLYRKLRKENNTE